MTFLRVSFDLRRASHPPGDMMEPRTEQKIEAKAESNARAARNAVADGAAIRAQELTRHYRMGDSVIRAVDGITLEVPAGEFLALLGSSGSGKSSLLNLLAGLDHPT
jgi:ABC-type glutathione transport system ATPase component